MEDLLNMATQIFVKQNGEYFCGYIELKDKDTWIDRTDYLESDNWFKRNIWHKFFPPKEFHVIITKGNIIHEIEGKW